jgi:hypothetical protein
MLPQKTSKFLYRKNYLYFSTKCNLVHNIISIFLDWRGIISRILSGVIGISRWIDNNVNPFSQVWKVNKYILNRFIFYTNLKYEK